MLIEWLFQKDKQNQLGEACVRLNKLEVVKHNIQNIHIHLLCMLIGPCPASLNPFNELLKSGTTKVSSDFSFLPSITPNIFGKGICFGKTQTNLQ